MSIVLDKKQDIVVAVRALAKQHQISYSPTATDDLAKNFTRLCGDGVSELDETQSLLVALRRAGHLDGPEFMDSWVFRLSIFSKSPGDFRSL